MKIFYCKKGYWVLLFLLISLTLCNYGFCQSILNKQVSIDIKNQPLEQALRTIGEKGDFHFSYNGLILSKDSIVNLIADNQSVRVVLDKLLTNKYEYLESKSFVIISPTLKKMSLTLLHLFGGRNRQI